MVNFMCEVDWLIIPDWIVAISTLVLTIVACIGLNAWKKEYKARNKDDAARKILSLIYQVQSRFWLEPIGSQGDKRLDPEFIIREFTNQYIEIVIEQSKLNWDYALPLIMSLKTEVSNAKLTFGNNMQDNLRSLVSYLEALRPGYSSNYIPTSTEMNGEILTAAEFTEKIIRNSILKLPKLISEIEKELSKHLV